MTGAGTKSTSSSGLVKTVNTGTTGISDIFLDEMYDDTVDLL